MKKTIISLLTAFAALCCTSASADVIGFDDLAGDMSAIPAGYGGFNWDPIGSINNDLGAGSGFQTGTVSGSNTAFNWYGLTASVSTASGDAFRYVGAWFTSAWVDQEISFEGSRNGVVVYSSGAFTIDTLTPQWIALDWADIDTLTIYNSSGTQWAMDDFTVPEPASLALFGGAFAGMAAARRRSARRAERSA